MLICKTCKRAIYTRAVRHNCNPEDLRQAEEARRRIEEDKKRQTNLFGEADGKL